MIATRLGPFSAAESLESLAERAAAAVVEEVAENGYVDAMFFFPCAEAPQGWGAGYIGHVPLSHWVTMAAAGAYLFGADRVLLVGGLDVLPSPAPEVALTYSDLRSKGVDPLTALDGLRRVHFVLEVVRGAEEPAHVRVMPPGAHSFLPREVGGLSLAADRAGAKQGEITIVGAGRPHSLDCPGHPMHQPGAAEG